jgi:hypothetical protein
MMRERGADPDCKHRDAIDAPFPSGTRSSQRSKSTSLMRSVSASTSRSRDPYSNSQTRRTEPCSGRDPPHVRFLRAPAVVARSDCGAEAIEQLRRFRWSGHAVHVRSARPVPAHKPRDRHEFFATERVRTRLRCSNGDASDEKMWQKLQLGPDRVVLPGGCGGHPSSRRGRSPDRCPGGPRRPGWSRGGAPSRA